MRQHFAIFVIFLTLPLLIWSQTGPQISGFYNAKFISENSNQNIRMGVFEIAVADEISDRFSYKGAICFENNESSIEGFLRTLIRPNLTLDFGKFDVPFGYEYKIADPIINPFTTTSLMNDSLSNCVWTDAGFNLNANVAPFNINIFVVNGVNNEKPLGLRAKTEISRGVTLGGSYSTPLEPVQGSKDYRINLFSILNIADFEFWAEYTHNPLELKSNSSGKRGYNLSSLYYVKPDIYIGCRFSQIDLKEDKNILKYDLGAGYEITENNLIKLFYSHQENFDKFTLETALSFEL